MLILQIVLTIIAWFRGWKGYALIPLAIGVIITFVFKYIANGLADPLTIRLIASICGVVINMALLIMCIVKRKDDDEDDDDELLDENSTTFNKENEESRNVKEDDFNEEPVTEEKEVAEMKDEIKNDNEDKSIGCESPGEIISTNKYYYSRGRKKKGPYTEEEFVKLRLRPDTLIWIEGLEKWQPLSDFDNLLKNPPPLPEKAVKNNTKSRKRIAISLIVLGLLFGISFISTYYIMENRRDTYLRLMNDEIDKIFDGKIALCEGSEYRTVGELKPVSKPIKSPTKSEDIYNEELAAYEEDLRTGAIERFRSEGISFDYQKLIRGNSGFRVESLWSEDMVYFYKATVQYGSNLPRRIVTPDEAYDNCYLWIINENSDCLTEGLDDKLSYLQGLRNRYYEISFRRSDKLSGGSRSTDYYRVYYERSASYYYIEDRFSIRQDFIKTLALFGAISIILTGLLYISIRRII